MTEQSTATENTKETKPKVPKIEQNGVTRPKDGTSTGKVWAICDKLSASAGAPADRGAVIDAAKAEGINEATAATQHGRWRKFHGLKGRTPKPATATTTTGTAEAAPAAAPEGASNGDVTVG